MNFKKSENLISTLLDDEIILLNMETDHYLRLNKTGSAIWNKIDEQKTFIDIIDEISKEFEINRILAEENIKDFFKMLSEYQLIEILNDE